jgi:DNA (cytosine-5)-methyltransferase 1
MDTITAKDRFALVQPERLDVRFRMLQPHELAAAMGFDGYVFAGTKTDQVRQIGNAVAVRTAQALCGAVLDAA